MSETGKNRIKRILRRSLYRFATKSIPSLDIVNMEREMEEMGEIYEICKNLTMSSKTRIYALYKAVEYIVNSNIPGDFVECGVYKGGSCMIMALTLIKMKDTNRKIYLYDTFKGMIRPTKEDVYSYSGVEAINIYEKKQNGEYSDWCFSALDEVKKNMFSTKYPEENLIFIEGKVQDTVPGTFSDRVALLRLDTDWYESTLHELNHFFPLLVNGGVLLVDD
ncbi:MAG: TylF/MycF family methyltransferase, partial [Actinobacteria bacterium]|nr:TylF/MycF family methyltransferase [Actinomycetota bacterium]